MAQKTNTRSSNSRRSTSASSRNGRRSTRKSAPRRPALEARRQANDTDVEYRRYVQHEEQDPAGPPDVLLDVPELRVDSIHFELDDLDAHVALKANVLNLVKLNVGVSVHLTQVKLDIKGVEAQVVLKARLDHVAAIVDRLMTSLDRNPELVKGLSRAIGEIGQGAGEAVDQTGDAAKEIGTGAQGALKDVGKGAGEATGDIGKGAGQAVGDVGQGAGQAVGQVGQGAGQAVGNLGQTVGGVGQAVGQAGQGVGQAAGGLTQGVGQAAGGLTQGGGQGGQGATPNGGGPQDAAHGAVAKEMAKVLARELAQAASEEARDLGLAATRKVRELGERREQRRAEKHHATPAAQRLADELGLDLAEIEGTGTDGRVTVNNIREAVEA